MNDHHRCVQSIVTFLIEFFFQLLNPDVIFFEVKMCYWKWKRMPGFYCMYSILTDVCFAVSSVRRLKWTHRSVRMSWYLSSSLGKTCRLLLDRDLSDEKYKVTTCAIVENMILSSNFHFSFFIHTVCSKTYHYSGIMLYDDTYRCVRDFRPLKVYLESE